MYYLQIATGQHFGTRSITAVILITITVPNRGPSQILSRFSDEIFQNQAQLRVTIQELRKPQSSICFISLDY